MSFVLVDHPHPGVTLITLNRPERMNAMAFDVMIPLREALEKVSVDNDTRVVVLTGAGHGFCSGADQEDAGIIPHIDGLTVPTIALRAMELLDDVIRAVRRMHQPVIGAINGAAVTGGLELAKRYGIACALVRPSDIDLAVRTLEGSAVKPGSTRTANLPLLNESAAMKMLAPSARWSATTWRFQWAPASVDVSNTAHGHVCPGAAPAMYPAPSTPWAAAMEPPPVSG